MGSRKWIDRSHLPLESVVGTYLSLVARGLASSSSTASVRPSFIRFLLLILILLRFLLNLYEFSALFALYSLLPPYDWFMIRSAFRLDPSHPPGYPPFYIIVPRCLN